MKWLLVILLALIGFSFIGTKPANSVYINKDTVPTGAAPQLFGSKLYEFRNYALIDSFLMVMGGDTFAIPRWPAIKYKSSDNRWYGYHGQRWRAFLNGLDTVSLSNRINNIPTLDTTSLSNRINQRSVITRLEGVVYSGASGSFNLSNFTTRGASPSLSGGGITFSGGANNLAQTLDLDTTMRERYFIHLEQKVGTISTTSDGNLVGIRSVNPAYTPGFAVGVILNNTGNAGKILLLDAVDGSLKATSSSAIAFNTNDTVVFEVDREAFTLTCKAWNKTSGTTPIYLTYNFSVGPTTFVLPNTGTFSVFHLGGNHIITDYDIISKEPKNAPLMCIGDSKTVGYYSSNIGRYPALLNTLFWPTITHAGSADKLDELLATTDDLASITPVNVTLSIGSNDIGSGQTVAQVFTKYKQYVSILNGYGINVYHLLPFYQPSIVSQLDALSDSIRAQYPAQIIDCRTPIRNCTPCYLSSDSVHLSVAGDSLVATVIANSGILKDYYKPEYSAGAVYTAVNVGSGAGLFKAKSGTDLQFKSITNDTSIVVTPNTNDLQFAVNSNIVRSANYLNRAVPFSNNSIFLGNSITVGYKVGGGIIKSYPDYIKDHLYLTGSFNNLAVSGAGARRNYLLLSQNLLPDYNTATSAMAGFNNVRGTTDTAHVFELVRATHRAMAGLLFIKEDQIQFYIMGNSSSVNPNVSTSAACGSCTASSEDSLQDYGSRTYYYRHNDASNTTANWWKKPSITANETVTIANVGGAGIAIGTWAATTAWSRIEVRVDGVLKTTYNPNNRVGTYWADGFTTNGITNDAIIITGLRDTLHSVELKFLDAGAMGGFDYVAPLKSPEASLSVPFYVWDLPHMNATGYNYPGGEVTQAQLDSCSSSRWRDLQYYFPGYPIARVYTNAYYNPDDPAQIQSDGIHPSSLGDWYIALAAVDVMGPKWLMKLNTVNTLDQVLTAGNTSSQRMLLTGSNSSNSNMEVGSDLAMQVYAPSNSWLASNMKFNGSNFEYLHNGYATQLYLNNNGYTEYKNAASGTTGGAATVNTRMTVTPSGDIWMGGSIISSVDGSGAKLKVHGSSGDIEVAGGANVATNIVIPSIINVGASAYASTEPLRFSNYGGSGGSQPAIILYNSTGGSDQKNYDITLGPNTLNFRLLNDAYNAANDWMTVTRSGYTSANVNFPIGNIGIGISPSFPLDVNGKAAIRTIDSSASPANMLWQDPTTKEIKKAAVPSVGNTIYTGDGSLSGNRTITGAGNTLTLTGTQSSAAAFNVNNTGNGEAISAVSTGTGSAFSVANSGSGTGGSISSNTGTAINATSTSGTLFRGIVNPSSTNTEIVTVRTIRQSTGTPAAGMGNVWSMDLEDDNLNNITAVQHKAVWTSPTSGATSADYQLWNYNAGTFGQKFTVKSTGQVQFNTGYGSVSFSGTPVSSLQTDVNGNLINGPLLASGTYTPTLTNGTNVTSSSASSCQYMRVGNTVTVSGKINVTPTSTGATALGISLPITSAIANDNECGGTSNVGNTTDLFGTIRGDATNDRAELIFTIGVTGTTSAQDWFFTFTYRII